MHLMYPLVPRFCMRSYCPYKFVFWNWLNDCFWRRSKKRNTFFAYYIPTDQPLYTCFSFMKWFTWTNICNYTRMCFMFFFASLFPLPLWWRPTHMYWYAFCRTGDTFAARHYTPALHAPACSGICGCAATTCHLASEIWDAHDFRGDSCWGSNTGGVNNVWFVGWGYVHPTYNLIPTKNKVITRCYVQVLIWYSIVWLHLKVLSRKKWVCNWCSVLWRKSCLSQMPALEVCEVTRRS